MKKSIAIFIGSLFLVTLSLPIKAEESNSNTIFNAPDDFVTGYIESPQYPITEEDNNSVYGSIPYVDEELESNDSISCYSMDTEFQTASLPLAEQNIQKHSIRYSYMVDNGGQYLRIFCDKSNFYVENYDSEFNILSRKKFDMELPMWGGFFNSKNAYYIVEGQSNTEEDTGKEVVRVIKYDKMWNRLGAASITGNEEFAGQIRYPFDAGCVNFTEHNGILYIASGHEGYVDEAVGQGHQGLMLMAINEDTLEGNLIAQDLWHSFAQYLDSDDTGLYLYELSEGSRATTLKKFNYENMDDNEYAQVFKYGGNRTSVWAVNTYSSVNGVALSDKNVIGIGTSIDQSQYDKVNENTPVNIYLTVTPKENITEEASKTIWLTDYTDVGKTFTGLNLTKINGNEFLVSWQEYQEEIETDPNNVLSKGMVHYIVIDGDGNKISKEYSSSGTISDCLPILTRNNQIVFYTSSSNSVDFYFLDIFTLKFAKKTYQVAGDNITWTVKDKELSFFGTGDLQVTSKAFFNYPFVLPSGSYVSYGSDNDWKYIRKNVETMTIKDGILSVPDEAFAGFSNLKIIKLEEGLKKIGNKSFEYVYSPEVYLPNSLEEIGEDAFWSGYYPYDYSKHLVYARFHVNCSTYAQEYVTKNEYRNVISHDFGEWISKSATCVEDGYKYRECSRCKEKKDVTTYKALGHDYSSDWIVDKEATFTEAGSESRHCSRCGSITDVRTIPLLRFIDVQEDTPHSEDINWLANTGVSQGWTEEDGSRTFRPFVNVARCDMAAFIRRLAKDNNWLDAATWKPSEADWTAFVDIDPSTPHAEDVLWLAHSEISEGWDIGSGKKEFRPYVSVARCDMAAFLYRLASKAGVSDAATWSPTESDWAFTDVNTGSSHVKEVLWLAHSGVSKGWVESDGTKTFRPLQNVARCDMAAFLHRLNDLH